MESVNEELRRAVDAAKEEARAKAAFLAAMSHEIRSPLNGVLGFAELALYDKTLNPVVRGHIEKIQGSANSILDIVNNVLDITSIEAGRLALEPVPFVLHDLLVHCETIIAPRAAEKGLMLYFYAEPNLSRRLSGDLPKLRQVLLNLLANAVKFTNVGVVKLMAVLSEKTPGRASVHFEIKDSGVGMDEEEMRGLFRSFSGAEAGVPRKQGGMGLGLAIAKRLIDIMGGRLQVESASGIGSKFSFDLEFDALGEANVGERKPQPPPLDCKRPIFDGEALVCEDSEINQQVIGAHLARVGFRATLTDDGRAGVEAALAALARGKPFDIVLMDIHMPVMDGLDAAREMRAGGVRCPIVALTANVMANDREGYARHGMNDFLAKPFCSTELWACLLRHLQPVCLTSLSEEEQDAVDNVTPADGELRSAPLIDRRIGLERAAGNRDLYQRLLRNFVRENQDLWKRLNHALNVGDIKLAHRMAHTLKSIAGTIGALELAKAAYGVEKSLADGSRSGLTPAAHKTLGEALAAVLAELAPLLESSDTVVRLKSAQAELDLDKARELANRLRPLLAAGSSASQDFLDEIRRVFAPLRELCARLAEHIDDFEFEAASADLEQVMMIVERRA